MRALFQHRFDLRSSVTGAVVAAVAFLGTSFTPPGGGGLTPEQQAVLDTMSLIDLDDGSGVLLPTIRFTGVNLQVVNGSGSTTRATAVGNLFVGYTAGDRGSHNLVGGRDNRFRSYGGLVTGQVGNQIDASAPYSTAIGGRSHVLSGPRTVNVGGLTNLTTFDFACAVGGSQNEARGPYSYVGGGRANIARGSRAVVNGGRNNLAAGTGSVCRGGQQNNAHGQSAAVGGGFVNDTAAFWASVEGGSLNFAGATRCSIAGGLDRCTFQPLSWVAGTLIENH